MTLEDWVEKSCPCLWGKAWFKCNVGPRVRVYADFKEQQKRKGDTLTYLKVVAIILESD
jgi:hypothetical protein